MASIPDINYKEPKHFSYVEDFSVPPPETVISLPSAKSASEQAFYAAGSYSQNPVEDYQIARVDLEQTGESALVNAAKERWTVEQNIQNKNAITEIMGDNTLNPVIRKAALEQYISGGFVPQTLRDKYAQKMASSDVGITVVDQQAQDLVIDAFNARKTELEKEDVARKVDDGKRSFMDIAKGTTSVVANILMSIPAGLAAGFTAIKEQDAGKAVQVLEEIQSYAYLPKEEGAQKVVESIANAMHYLGIPAQWVGDKLFDATDSPVAGAFGQTILDPVALIPVGKLASLTKRAVVGKPHIPPGSPADVTLAANPEKAAQLGTIALKSENDNFVEALGTTKGDIVSDWVLPKLPEEVTKNNVDLTGKIKELDVDQESIFVYHRYDPNIVSATRREEDLVKIEQIIRQNRAPYYQQSNSQFEILDDVTQGKFVFGRDGVSGFTTELAAETALKQFKESVEGVYPKDQQGVIELVKKDTGYHIEWTVKQEYDEVSNLIFGKDSINTSVLGIDASGLARSKLGRWVFSQGKLPDWTEKATSRGIERAAIIEKTILEVIQKNMKLRPIGKELEHIIDEGESIGKEFYTRAELESKFPHLKNKDMDSLYQSHIYWRRLQQYKYNWINREMRHDLSQKSMQGIYDESGSYLGAATTKIPKDEIGNIHEVWDMATSKMVPFTEDIPAKQGKTLVRLNEKIDDIDGVYNYALLSGKHQLSLLPRELLPNVPGYSSRKVKENFFVEITPKKLRVDGVDITDPLKLSNYSKVKTATRNEAEGNLVKAQLENDYPDHTVKVRPERMDSYGRVVTDYQVHGELLRQSMKRGERLPSRDGLARIEDRLVSEINSIQSLSRMGAMRQYNSAFKESFIKSFREFLPDGEFPEFQTSLRPPENMDRATKVRWDTANRSFEQFARMNTFETFGDYAWKQGMTSLADWMDSWKLGSDVLRDVGKKGNLLVKYPKMAATLAYIHMNPLRQWMLQPAQMLELYAINPLSFSKNMTQLIPVRMALLSGATSLGKHQALYEDVLSRMPIGMSKAEFNDVVQAIRESGTLQAVDMNVLVHGIFKNLDRNLVENTPARYAKDLEAIVKGVPKAARAVGFDFAEITNRVGLWMQTKDIWIENNPGKNWKTKEAKETIAAEANRLAGNMNKAGNLPYQEGALSVFFQFAAINQKMLVNLIQDNATILSPAQRARLAATRAVLYGAKYGLPGGAAAYYFLDQSDDPEVHKYKEVLKSGILDYTANNIIGALVDPDNPTELAVGKSITPYSEKVLPYIDFMYETWKLADSNPSNNPRYPALTIGSSMYQAVDQIKGWFTTREVNEQSFGSAVMDSVQFVAELSSGPNNYAKMQLALGMQDMVTKNGNKLGMEMTKTEAYGKLFGFQTQEELDLWKMKEVLSDHAGEKKDMAKNIHQMLMKQRKHLGEPDMEVSLRRLNSFMSLLSEKHFSPTDKDEMYQEIVNLDRKSFTTVKESLFADVWKYHAGNQSEAMNRVMNILRSSGKPQTKDWVEKLEKGQL